MSSKIPSFSAACPVARQNLDRFLALRQLCGTGDPDQVCSVAELLEFLTERHRPFTAVNSYVRVAGRFSRSSAEVWKTVAMRIDRERSDDTPSP